MKPKKPRITRRKRVAGRLVKRRSTAKPTGSNSKDIYHSTKGKLGELGLGSNVSDETIHHLAQGVDPHDIKDEEKMRQLIHQVSKAFNVPVDEKTVKELAKTLKSTDMNQISSMLGGWIK
jgi:hypothetical protein